MLCLLFSYYIYAEYDRYVGEKTSKEILDSVVIADNSKTYVYDDTTVKIDDENLTIILDSNSENTTPISTAALEEAVGKEKEEVVEKNVLISENGTKYYKIAIINIPEINLSYPVFSEFTDELLKISPCKFWGADPNEVGNFCIVGHNYRNEKFFSKVPTLTNGSIIEIVDLQGRKVNYEVYDKFVVSEDDNDCTSQLTDGRREITLITCTNDSKNRVIVKATEKL